MMINIQLVVATFLVGLLGLVAGYQPGDRMSMMIQTMHASWKTQKIDAVLHQMPRFRKPDSVVLHAPLPHEEKRNPEMLMALHPDEDVKISLTFHENRLQIPWIVLFDAKSKRSLYKLTITFTHDEFDVLRLNYTLEYGKKIQRFDPTHPSLTACQVVYQWEAIEEQDLERGISALFLLSFSIFVGLAVYITCTYDREETFTSRAYSESASNVKAAPMPQRNAFTGSYSVPTGAKNR